MRLVPIALVASIVSSSATAAPEGTRTAAGDTVAGLEERQLLQGESGRRIREDPEAAATRLDVAAIVARALELSAAARRPDVARLATVTREQRDRAQEIRTRLDRLIAEQEELRRNIRQLREDRRR
ncbi:MAG: hypothetical protein HYY25_08010 [Candidatus Wallbacteria bacterium]|nr:hypothetical protein [Candidatus Wallbacteria bacterium]MBI4869867.1 hypothetical protein [Candidatus Wallbacteria bacterium]